MSVRRSIVAGAAVASLLFTALAAAGSVATVPSDRASSAGPGAYSAQAFEAAEGDTRSVRFTASGDFTSGGRAAAVLSQIGALHPDLHLALGDLSYGAPGAEAAWCDFVRSRVGADLPFELISGNHESNGANGDIRNFAACLPNRLPGLVGDYAHEYYLDVPQANPLVRFIMISPALDFPNGTWSYSPGTPHYEWTANAIDSARSAGVRWVVVGMHKPCLSVGQYRCDPGEDLMNLLVRKRVDLVLSGHEHLYARSKQLALGDACPRLEDGQYTAGCVRDADQSLVKGSGTVFGIVGTGGTALRDVNPGDAEAPYFAASSGSNATPTWGNLEVSVTADVLMAQFRPAVGVFSDSFTISRTPPTTEVLARDTFSRTVSGGFGRAEVGGTWSTSGGPSQFSVDRSGRILFPRDGERNSAVLGGVASTATDLSVTVSASSSTPIGASLAVSGRRISGAGAYQAKLSLADTGVVRLSLVKVNANGGGEVVLQPAANVPRLASGRIQVRLQVIGTAPTVLRAKVWAAGTPQPSGWLRATRDGSPSLQRPGGIGFTTAAPQSSSTYSFVRLDDLRAIRP